MKKKIIALLLVTATLVSACGAEEETSKEDIEINETEETPKADSVSTTDDEEVAKTDGEETATSGDATTTDGNMATGGALAVNDTGKTYEEASVTIEQSDVNSNLWIITNKSSATYRVITGGSQDPDGFWPRDSYFAPGEVLYYFTSPDEAENVNDLFLFAEDDISNMGEDYDTQCSVVTISYDSSKYDESAIYERGYALYSLDDVWDKYKLDVCYPNMESVKDYTHVIYFRLFDADGNVIYEPADLEQFKDLANREYFDIWEGLLADPSIISNWDHAEFYITTRT
ncbi:hypothetical protein SAMN02745229_00548 [Butyrivibrio fibrisolvens DSM 3071]|uniref:Uncharacterized protein n=1 Tax=Butyrivibrio fibrisolvens DSM 3071 TaxID=1121131 RepID=A0A1M5TC65_BUTFI|nr:hypothetical protein [Butyrivibrio fibrisolvens]SHH48276.1 hypothetical protein SAMN02745229_00548 [Butyrivibrio fibrisolvens DSM 3071]